MSESVSATDLLDALLFLMEETFEGHSTSGNSYLDRGTGFVPTLEALSAQEASRPIVEGGTTIAGQVEHTRYYLSVLREFAAGRTERVDWRESWQVKQVSAEEWNDLRKRLWEEQRLTVELMRANDKWDEDRIGWAFGTVAHCAYHLGAVRQMVKVVGS